MNLLHRCLDRVCTVTSLLVLPLSWLLLLQWPLRDLLGAYSREANDMAQWIFALYVAVALRYASRRGQHVATQILSAHYAPRWQRRLARGGHSLAVLPFALYVVIIGWPMTQRALIVAETFPDTGNPGYFLIKLSAWFMALLMALHAAADLLPLRQEPRDAP